MNKYKLLFDLLKPKVGPDPARIIIYDIFCNDTNKPTLWLGEHMRKIYKSSYSGLFTYDLFETKYNNITGKFQLSFGFCFNQKLENLPDRLQSLILGNDFNQKLENLPGRLQNLTFYAWSKFNQKLENLPNSLQNLTLGYDFNQKLDLCVTLPKLQNLTLFTNYGIKVPPILNTAIVLRFVCDGYYVENLYKKYENYKNYNVNEWKNIFYKSINIK